MLSGCFDFARTSTGVAKFCGCGEHLLHLKVKAAADFLLEGIVALLLVKGFDAQCWRVPGLSFPLVMDESQPEVVFQDEILLINHIRLLTSTAGHLNR